MTEQVKQHTIKVLEFLKNHQDIDNLTLKEIQERLIEYEGLLIEFVEKVLGDEENENGTLTTWWLYESVTKRFFFKDQDSLDTIEVNVEKAEDFVNFMIESLQQNQKN